MIPHKPRRLELTQEELDKVARAKARDQTLKVDPEWMFAAEFGYYFGWEGVQAILTDQITFEEASLLLQGAIKVWYGKLVQQGQVTYTASVAAQSKKGKRIMEQGLKEYKKAMKADV